MDGLIKFGKTKIEVLHSIKDDIDKKITEEIDKILECEIKKKIKKFENGELEFLIWNDDNHQLLRPFKDSKEYNISPYKLNVECNLTTGDGGYKGKDPTFTFDSDISIIERMILYDFSLHLFFKVTLS